MHLPIWLDSNTEQALRCHLLDKFNLPQRGNIHINFRHPATTLLAYSSPTLYTIAKATLYHISLITSPPFIILTLEACNHTLLMALHTIHHCISIQATTLLQHIILSPLYKPPTTSKVQSSLTIGPPSQELQVGYSKYDLHQHRPLPHLPNGKMSTSPGLTVPQAHRSDLDLEMSVLSVHVVRLCRKNLRQS